MSQEITRFIFIVTMICLASSAIAKSPLWSIATDDAQKHVFFTQQCISYGHQEGTRGFDQCVKKLTLIEKKQGVDGGDKKSLLPQMLDRRF
jgi:hypothetical protein